MAEGDGRRVVLVGDLWRRTPVVDERKGSRGPCQNERETEHQEGAVKAEKPKRGGGAVCKHGVDDQMLVAALWSESRSEREERALGLGGF
jgi:hypothetical protein